ncbi:MAG: 3'-5' exoribonuclease [Termitinemataceae bacterium]|nr:MAG: 3'-5' exoribonuclease [Termitinemataceae bacterium]
MSKKNHALDKFDFAAIDFETGQYSRESAISIGLVKYIDGKKVDSYYSLIKPPKMYIRADFTKIHGLTLDDVRDAPDFSKIWEPNILPFIDGLPLVAHNAEFDMGVLRAVLEWYDIAPPSLHYFCSLKIARKTWTELNSHALSALGRHFGIVYNAHNALDDAETCAEIVNRAVEKHGSTNLRELFKSVEIRFKKL